MAVVVEVEIGSKKALSSLNDLKTASTQLEDKLSNATFGSDEFKRLSGQLKSVRSELKDFDLQLEGLDKEQRATALVDTFTGLTGAVGAVSSAFIAFGASSEKIENAEKKLLGVIGVVSGLRDVSNGLVAAGKLFGPTFTAVGDQIKAGFVAGATGAQTFKAALISTGIGAFIVAVGVLIANMDKLVEYFSGVTAEQKAFNETLNEGIAAQMEQTMAIEQLADVLQDENVALETKKQAYKELQESVPALTDYTYEEAKATGVLTKAIALQIDAIKSRALAEAFSKKAAEEAVKQAEINNRTVEESISLGQRLLNFYVASTSPFGVQAKDALNAADAVKNNSEELNKSRKIQQVYSTESEKYLKQALELEGQLNTIQETGTKIKTKKANAGKTYTDALAKERTALKATYDLALATLEAEKQAALLAAKTADERIQIEENFTQKALNLKEKYIKDIYAKTETEKRNAQDLAAQLKQVDNERITSTIETNEELKALADQRNDALIARQEAFAALSTQLGEEAATNILTTIQNQISAVETNTIAGVEKLRQLQAQLIEQERQKAIQANEQAKIDRLAALQTQLTAELELYKGNEEAIAAVKAQYAEQTEAIQQQAADNAVSINADANAKIVANDKEAADQKVAINKASVDAILGFASTVVTAIDGLAEEGTKAQKAVEISKILISAATSAFQAFAQATALIPPPAGQIVGGVLAGVIAAGAAKAIANVNKVQVGGGGGGTGTIGSFGGGASASGNVPGGLLTAPTQGNQYGLFGNSGAPTVGGGGQENGPVIKTYVLAGDVTSAQEANAKINQRRKL